MIIELIKKASAAGLHLQFDFQDGCLSCECLDTNEDSWYSYSGVDVFEVVKNINDFIEDPISFTKRFMEEIELAGTEVIEG